MAKKVTGMIKLQVQAGKANPAPPIGSVSTVLTSRASAKSSTSALRMMSV